MKTDQVCRTEMLPKALVRACLVSSVIGFLPASTTAQWTERTMSAGFGNMAFDTARGVAVLVRPSTGSSMGADVWEWNAEAWTKRDVAGPRPRAVASIAYDRAREVR